MSKLDDLEGKLNAAIEADKARIQLEIDELQAKADALSSEVSSLWKKLGGGFLIWTFVLLLLFLIADAWANTRPDPPPALANATKMFIGAISVLGFYFVLFIVGTVLVIALIVAIVTSISKGATISSLKSKIASEEKTILELDD